MNRSSLLFCLALLLMAPAAKPAQEIWGLEHLSRYMERYKRHSSAFAKYQFSISSASLDNPNSNFWAAQLAATDSSFMGRPNDALRYFPIASHAPASVPEPSHYQATDARAWIAGQAPAYRVVMINEAHHIPQTRLLTLSLLKPLYDAGFRYLALETLANSSKSPLPNGYPQEKSGGYTREPIMADLVREALRLGYTLVPYEAPASLTHDIGAREQVQARNLETFLSAHPDAKLLVHAGYAHIAKTDRVKIGGMRVMATQLISATRAPVLSIDQIELMPMSVASHEAIAVQARLAEAFSISGPVVFLSRQDDAAWSAEPGAYDASVLLPPSPIDVVRPDWLSLDGVRRKVHVGADACADHFPCLVQAFVLGESRDAIPADQFVFQVGADARTPLFLRDGDYRLRYTTSRGQVVYERRMDVPDRLGEIVPERTR